MSCKLLILAVTCCALAACNTANKRIGQEDPFLGEAVKYNAAVQTINPDPAYPDGSAQPGDHGEKGAKSVERYRADQVRARHKAEANASSTGLSTTQGTSGSGGGSGPR